MQHAFPHDELKPITKDYTDSLGKYASTLLLQAVNPSCNLLSTANKFCIDIMQANLATPTPLSARRGTRVWPLPS